MKTLTAIAALGLLVAACGTDEGAGATTTSPDTTVPPTTTTSQPDRSEPGPAFVDAVTFVFLESDPVQVRATISGTLPTPCHDLVVTRDGDRVDVSSRFDPTEVCVEVLEPFETTVDLGSKDDGAHTLEVNGETYDYTVGSEAADDMITGPAFVEDVEFVFLESYPVQVRATITGNVPTPCHTAEASVADPVDGRIVVEVTSAAPADQMCAQVLEPFELTVDVGDFETGDYAVVIDGVEYPFTI